MTFMLIIFLITWVMAFVFYGMYAGTREMLIAEQRKYQSLKRHIKWIHGMGK